MVTLRRGGAAGQSLLTGASLQAMVVASGILAARLLGVDDRGRLALLWIVSLAVGQLATLGLHAAISYQLAAGQSRAEVLNLVRRPLAFQLLAALPAQAVVLASMIDLHHSEILASAIVTLAVSPVLVLFICGQSIAQGMQDFPRLQRHRVSQGVAYLCCLVLLLLVGEGRLLPITTVWVLTLVGAGLYCWRDCAGTWWPPRRPLNEDDQHARADMARFGRRAMFGAFGATEHLMLDQLLVGALLPVRELGLFAAAAAFANLPRFLGQSIGMVAYPRVAAAGSPAMRRVVARRFVGLGLAIGVPTVAALVASVGLLLPLAFGDEFRPAVPLARLLLAAGLLQALRRILTEASRGYGSGAPGAIAEGVFTGALLTAGVLLAPVHGATGAATAVLVAALVGNVTLVVLLRFRATDPYPETEAVSPRPPGRVPPFAEPVAARPLDAP